MSAQPAVERAGDAVHPRSGWQVCPSCNGRSYVTSYGLLVELDECEHCHGFGGWHTFKVDAS